VEGGEGGGRHQAVLVLRGLRRGEEGEGGVAVVCLGRMAGVDVPVGLCGGVGAGRLVVRGYRCLK